MFGVMNPLRIAIPAEVFWPLMIILGVLAVIGLAVVMRYEGWDGTKGMSPEDAERARSAFQKQFKRELPVYGPLIVLALACVVFVVVAKLLK